MKFTIGSSEKKPEKQNEKQASDYGVITPEWTLSEIVLSAKVKDSVDDIVAFCKEKEKIVEEWELKRFLKGKGGTIAINFFGAPGTGKSILAEAIAHKLERKLIKADYAEITDSLMGGTEKKLSDIFDRAEKNDAVLFFDEADGLLSKRNSNSKNAESANQIKSHLLTLLDRSNIIIIFATNLFENYDKAFFRRILFHLQFDMPDFTQRVDLWKFHLSAKIPKSISYEELAEMSDTLAGGDIKNITLKLCIKLSANKLTSLDKKMVEAEIEKYVQALAASQGGKLIKKLPDEQ